MRIPDFDPKSCAERFNHPSLHHSRIAFQRTKRHDKFGLLSRMADGGNVFNQLEKERPFDPERVRLFDAELVCVREYLHQQCVVACLKPDNSYLNPFGNIFICTPRLFGLNGNENENGDRVLRNTPEYAAPETLGGDRPTRAADWWTLGVLLHEFLTGIPPFYHRDREDKERKIAIHDLTPLEGATPAAKDLVARLLDKDPAKRLGAGGADDVKSHAFFAGVDWQELPSRKTTARAWFGSLPHASCASKPAGPEENGPPSCPRTAVDIAKYRLCPEDRESAKTKRMVPPRDPASRSVGPPSGPHSSKTTERRSFRRFCTMASST